LQLTAESFRFSVTSEQVFPSIKSKITVAKTRHGSVQANSLGKRKISVFKNEYSELLLAEYLIYDK
jgi:hypothetical protein